MMALEVWLSVARFLFSNIGEYKINIIKTSSFKRHEITIIINLSEHQSNPQIAIR